MTLSEYEILMIEVEEERELLVIGNVECDLLDTLIELGLFDG